MEATPAKQQKMKALPLVSVVVIYHKNLLNMHVWRSCAFKVDHVDNTRRRVPAAVFSYNHTLQNAHANEIPHLKYKYHHLPL